VGLLGNGSVLNKDNGFCTSGTGAQSGHAGNFHKGGRYRNRHWFIPKQSSNPEGYQFDSFKLAQKSGGMGTVNNLLGSGTLTNGNLAGGLNGVAPITGTGSITTSDITAFGIIVSALTGSGTINSDIKALGVIVASLSGVGSITDAAILAALNGTASLSGSGGITNASIAGVLSAVATIAGTSTFTGDIAGALNAVSALVGSSSFTGDIVGKWEMVGALTGNGSITTANANAIANLISALIGNGSITTSTISGPASMSADVTPYTALSPESLAAAVLNSLLASYTNPGTVGEALNNANAAGNPWDALLADNVTTDTFGAFVQKLLTQSKYIGLK
jgi:hypothetical protein